MSGAQVKIHRCFIAYARPDADLCRQLDLHLTALKNEGWIQTWHDGCISAGTAWQEEIFTQLDSADMFLLIVTKDFLASEFCLGPELRRVIDRHRMGKTRVIPVIARPCDWHGMLFARFQVLPGDGRPIVTWRDPDEAWLSVVSGIRGVLMESAPSAPQREAAMNQTSSPNEPSRGQSFPLPATSYHEGHTIAGKSMANGGAPETKLPSAIIQECFQGLSTRDLQSRVIEPLLRESDFRQVRDISAPDAEDRTLLATKDEVGILHFYAIQIKKLEVCRGERGRKDLALLMLHLKQAITEPVFDPITQSHRTPDRLLLVTPCTIDQDALNDTIYQHREVSRNQVTIIDGPILAEQAIKRIPNLLASLRGDIAYRLQLARENSRVLESKVFNVNGELLVEDIFVDMQFACFESARRLLLTLISAANAADIRRREELKSQFWNTDPLGQHDLTVLRELRDSWLTLTPPEAKAEELQVAGVEEFTIGTFLYELNVRIDYLLNRLDELADETISTSKVRTICIEVASLQRAMTGARRLKFLERRILDLSPSDNAILHHALNSVTDRSRSPTYRHLAHMTGTIIITGPAGAGKTTLLRKLLLHVARGSSSVIPIFLRAMAIRDVSESGVIRHIYEQFQSRSYPLHDHTLEEQLQSGRIMLLLDGLDEAANNLKPLKASIARIARRYPEAPFFITCRDTIDLSDWEFAVHLKLKDFSEGQLDQFIENWFSTQPSLIDAARESLRKRPSMREVLRRPVIAAVFCSLIDADADIPTSESELYESRADLLLGRWEQAKGIPPMRRDARERYLMFLMELAHHVHSGGVRTFGYHEIQEHARHYYAANWNKSVNAFIRDCVSRGLLSIEDDDVYSFGHLTYQEFFAAKFLAHHNQVDQIAVRLGSPWWQKVLEFYAALKLDIGPLLRHVSMMQGHLRHRKELETLRKLAPLTST